MTKTVPILFCILVLLFISPITFAQNPSAGKLPDKKLLIATKEAAPFSIKKADGSWEGISIALWEQIADQLDLQYEYRETTLEDMVESLEKGSVDLAVAALTVTMEREKEFDFTHAFYTTGLSVATSREGGGLLSLFLGILSLDFLKAVGALSVVLLVFGFLVWLFERKKNPEEFGGSSMSGIGAGFWWSAVTMTTVGYGDKSPRSLGGRLIALVWMFLAIIIISSFTAAIASALTLNQLQSSISSVKDLQNVKVGSVQGSTSEAYLRSSGIFATYFETVEEGLEAVKKGQIEAMVYDAPILRYLVNTAMKESLQVVPFTFSRQDYGIAFPAGSPLREPVNQHLLANIREPQWNEILRQYLGAE